MDDSNRSFSDLVGVLKSWIPWGPPEPAHESRDFWMPDHSCRVCYECDSQFTLFNRRHHCRHCGRIFCLKCTSNRVPTRSTELENPQEVRVCNFCFKQCQQGISRNELSNNTQDPTSSSLFAKSFISNNGSTNTLLPAPDSSTSQLPMMDTNIDGQTIDGAVNTDRGVDIGEGNRARVRFEFGSNRSDNEDQEFRGPRFGSTTSHFSHAGGYFSHSQFDDMDSHYNSLKVHHDGDALDSTSINSYSINNSFESHTPGEADHAIQKGSEHDVSDECEAPSSCASEDLVSEPVDFENNGVLWLPPDPEGEECEKEALLFEDDDDGSAAGEFGHFRDPSSFGSGEYKIRDKSNEKRKRAMKNVVDAHFRALITRLLQVENLSSEHENDKEGWLEIITGLSWEASLLLKPDMTRGGQMDPSGYVKVKCLASGLRSQSMVVKGVVCKKNVAHRRMASKFEKPRLLILGGALEYHRVSNALSSFDTLLQQEMDHLKMAVAKIDSHHPDILLVEKSVSRYAQEYLLAKNISLVLNIKRPLLERIARCTDGQIVPSIDHLSSQKLGYCEKFRVEKVSEEHGTALQAGKKLVKTLMYFEGCPKPLGCTILLRGANVDELKKVKHVVQYGVLSAYNLDLETSFLADEGASLPELPLYAPITVALPDKTKINRSISTIPDFTVLDSEKTKTVGEPLRTTSVPTSELFRLSIAPIHGNEHATSYLPASMGFQYTDMSASCSEKGPQYPFSRHASEAKGLADLDLSNNDCGDLNVKTTQSDCLESDAGKSVVNPISVQVTGEENVEVQPDLKEFPHSPSDHQIQSILVSLSSRCVWKGTVCERSQLFRIKYYGNFDKPLGRFLRDHLFDQNYRCRSCDMPAEAHVECYTHRQGTLIISVKKLSEIILPGEKDGKIWMWHRCLKCPRVNGFPPASRRVVMSDAAWGLSFGKFLELNFSSHAAASRVANCGHSLHRDCLRFYGFGKMIACFRYASIDVHSVYLPPHKLVFNYERQDWIEQELKEVAARAELLFSEVLAYLRLLVERKSDSSVIKNGKKVPESRRHLADLEGMLQSEKSEFEESLHKISNREPKKGEPAIDILDLNRLQRQLVFQSYMWDHRLIYANSLDNNSQPVDIPETLLNQRSGAFSYPDPENQNPVLFSIGKDAADESDAPRSNLTHLRVLSEDQIPICLSYTLDAAWTGENHLDNNNDNNSLSEPVKTNNYTSGKSEVEEDHSAPSFLSSKGTENMEETMSWMGTFYRSLNKNFMGSGQKLDTFGEYDPVFISTFRDSETQGGARLLLPVGLNDTVIPLYEDEPTSVISYALLSPDYLVQLSNDLEKPKDFSDSSFSIQSLDSGNFQYLQTIDEVVLDSYRSFGPGDENMLSSRGSQPLDPLSYTKALHARVSIADDGPRGKVRYTVTCYYAKRFDALRKICCPLEIDFARSLSRCKKWGAQGGKSNVFFAKTMDQRFIIKQVTKTELESFIKFAPEYFKYLSESIGTRSPTCLAKIFGIFQVTSKHLRGGKKTKMDLLVMENLLFQRNVTRLYDLKGSSRSRYNPDSSGSNKVLLDQNLIEAMPTSPIFVGNKAKKMLERAVWNDTAFLAFVDVMDYSLLVGVDEETHELVIGIIDFMRQYTWDKHLETWVKASGILGGPKNASPTVISPKQYKRRFRKAMTNYFLMVPDQWLPPTTVSGNSQTELSEEKSEMVDPS